MYSSKDGVPLFPSIDLHPRTSDAPSNTQINGEEAVRRLEQGGPPKAITKFTSTQQLPPIFDQVSVGFSPSFNLRAFLSL